MKPLIFILNYLVKAFTLNNVGLVYFWNIKSAVEGTESWAQLVSAGYEAYTVIAIPKLATPDIATPGQPQMTFECVHYFKIRALGVTRKPKKK